MHLSGASSFIVSFVVVACSLDVDPAGAGKACSEGRCAAGYVCNAEQRCVSALDVPDAVASASGGGSASSGGSASGGNGGVAAGSAGALFGGIPNGTGGAAPGTGGRATPSTPEDAAAPTPRDAGTHPPTPVDASHPTPDASCATPTAYYYDGDRDGFGRNDLAHRFCSPPPGAWATLGDDCNDAESSVFPGQTAYFGTPYASARGDSFDYDCSGTEEPDLSVAGAAPDCPALALLVCLGAGYAPTARRGTGVNATCGSDHFVTCTGLLACAPTTSVATPKGCR